MMELKNLAPKCAEDWAIVAQYDCVEIIDNSEEIAEVDIDNTVEINELD